MTYLGSLIARAGGVTTPLRPLLPARFEPSSPAEVVVERAQPAPAEARPAPAAVAPAPAVVPAAAAPTPSLRRERPHAASRAVPEVGVAPARRSSRSRDASTGSDTTRPVEARAGDGVDALPTAPRPRADAPARTDVASRHDDPWPAEPRPATAAAAPAATPATPAPPVPATIVVAPPGPALRPADAGSHVPRRGRDERDAAPTVRVSIGRVELRTPPVPRSVATAAQRQPRLSLDDYLRERSR